MPAPELRPLFAMKLQTSMASMMGGVPGGGTRAIVAAASGSFEGDRLRGTVEGPGGDWVVVRPDGTMRLDVRVLLRTADGADILMTYLGVGTPNGLRTAPLFETGDERYAWLNDVQAVAVGEVAPDLSSVSYEVFEVA
jgi:hypothetical protein